MITQKLQEAISRLRKSEGHYPELKDVMVILNTLREDKSLNIFLRRRKSRDMKVVIEGDVEIIEKVKKMIPSYDSDNLDAIQQLIDETTVLADFITHPYYNGSNVPDTHYFDVRHERILRLMKEDIHVQIEFGTCEDSKGEKLYAAVSYDCGNFILDTKTVVLMEPAE